MAGKHSRHPERRNLEQIEIEAQRYRADFNAKEGFERVLDAYVEDVRRGKRVMGRWTTYPTISPQYQKGGRREGPNVDCT